MKDWFPRKSFQKVIEKLYSILLPQKSHYVAQLLDASRCLPDAFPVPALYFTRGRWRGEYTQIFVHKIKFTTHTL